jgi:hypothetical protein
MSLSSPPVQMQFESYHHHDTRDIEICVPPDFGFSEVIVRSRRWPFSGVRVYVNGRRWGLRGDMTLAA